MTNIELIRSAYDAYERRDMMAAFSLFSSDLEIIQTPLLPWGGHYKGTTGAMMFFSSLGSHVSALPQIETYIPAGDDVVAIGRLRGKAKETDKPIDIAIAHVWSVRESKIVKFAAYIDTPAMLEALS